jgi:hypothetical protein
VERRSKTKGNRKTMKTTSMDAWTEDGSAYDELAVFRTYRYSHWLENILVLGATSTSRLFYALSYFMFDV